MRSIKEFIYYFRTCPLCNNWITLDVDLPIATSLEIKEDKLVLTTIEDKEENNRIFNISFKNNKVDSSHPFAFRNLINIIKRLYFENYEENFKIEARCYSCNNFRYWSKSFIFNQKSKRIRNIGVAGEKFQLHELNGRNEKISYIIFNNCKNKKSKLVAVKPNLNRKEYDIPYIPFKSICFDDKEKLLSKIRNMLILT